MFTLKGIFTATLLSLFRLGSALSVRQGMAYYNPTAGGGSMLDNAGNGYGEPLNVRFGVLCFRFCFPITLHLLTN